MKLLIYTDVSKPRIVYTLNFVFRCVLGLDISIISNKKLFCESNERKLNYSDSTFPTKCLNITPSALLIENNIHKFKATIKEIEEIPYIQCSDSYRFDPFSNIFFMISRYEEYCVFEEDEHNRFPASASILYQNDLLDFPLVDAWIDWIRKELNRIYQDEDHEIPSPSYRFTPTYDIDIVRAYLWKGFIRSIGGLMKDLSSFKLTNVKERFDVWLGKKNDPFDVFHQLSEYHKGTSLSPIYFWILGDFGTFDKNPNYKKPAFRNQIKKITDDNHFGIHPSYASFLNKTKIAEEKKRLESISGKAVLNNRFHFLRFKLADSYRMLLELGISADFSMGFPNAPGFRAGTSHSFYWYDLEKEKVTNLMIHPFQVMDVSLKNYLNLSPEEGYERSIKILNEVKKYGGNFVTLWHNSSFDEKEWNGWKDYYEKLLKEAQEGSSPSS